MPVSPGSLVVTKLGEAELRERIGPSRRYKPLPYTACRPGRGNDHGAHALVIQGYIICHGDFMADASWGYPIHLAVGSTRG
jgi:hypothetical protein